MSLDESATHARFGTYLREIIDPVVAEQGGRAVRSMGDGLLVEFDSAIAAVRAALAIQRGLAERDRSAGEEQRIRLRIGINTGDVIVDERDIYGNSVNVAARLQSLAGPGEIYATQSVRDQLRGLPGIWFEDRGELQLKNIQYPVRVFRIVDQHQTDPAPAAARLVAAWRRAFQLARSRPRTTIPLLLLLLLTGGGMAGVSALRDHSSFLPRSSIIVLPFRDLSDDRSQQHFVDAVTEDVTTDLSRIPGAFVIARGTAFTFKDLQIDPRQVGRELGVRYLLEGSLRKVGGRVQVNTQLIDASSGATLWADRFDQEIKDLWALQEHVTGRIASSLDIQLAQAESRRAARQGQSSDADAVDLRLRAVGLYLSGINPENTLAARQLLEQSAQLDPNSAETWAWLADLILSDYLHHWNDIGKPQLVRAEEAASRALALDPNLALAHYARGFLYRTKGDHSAALEAFAQASKANPNFARAYAQQANELILLGHPKEAAGLIDKAIKLSPRDPSLGYFYWVLGRAHFYAENYRDAIPWLRRSIELRQKDWFNRLYLVAAYALSGQPDAAKKTLDEFRNAAHFKNFTVARVVAAESRNPSDNPTVVAARGKMRQALLDIGMAER